MDACNNLIINVLILVLVVIFGLLFICQDSDDYIKIDGEILDFISGLNANEIAIQLASTLCRTTSNYISDKNDINYNSVDSDTKILTDLATLNAQFAQPIEFTVDSLLDFGCGNPFPQNIDRRQNQVFMIINYVAILYILLIFYLPEVLPKRIAQMLTIAQLLCIATIFCTMA